MSSEDLNVLKTLVELVEQGRACALVTVVETKGSAPRAPGAKMLVGTDRTTVGTVGGGALEQAAVDAGLEAIRSGRPTLLAYELKKDLGMACGGSAELFIEPQLPASRLYIFGGGHVGAALCPLAAATGFSVTVIDERPEFASAARHPAAAALVSSYDPDQWGELIFDPFTFCVVVTPAHESDTRIVSWLLGREARYVGMIGSKRKRAAVERVIGDPKLLERLHTPIGLSINAETPAEIAVSILAELVQVRGEATQGAM